MADVTVTIGAQVDGSFSAATQQAKSQLAEIDAYRNVRAGTAIGAPTPSGLGGPPPLPGPLTRAAMAQVAARRRLEEQNQKTSQSEEQLEEATERTASSFERMAGRILTRLVVFEALRLAFDGIKNTIEAASQKQFDVVQFRNVADAVKDINTELGNTEKIAEATAQSFDQVYQARLKMYEAGVGFEQQGAAVQIAGELGRIWGEDAGRLSEMEAHISTGTASEAEMYHIATLLGGEFRKQADAYRDMVTQAPLIERAMERQKVLADRQLEDQQRIGNIRQAFYEQHGVAEQAFQDKYRSVDPTDTAAKERAIYDASYSARAGLQQKFAEGQKQMQKDLGVSDTTMTELINSGVVGSKELLDASREAEQERKRNADRGFQDQKAAIDLGKDQTKLSLLQQERDALFDQVKAQQMLNDLTEKYNTEQQTIRGQLEDVGASVKRAQEESGTVAEAPEIKEALTPLMGFGQLTKDVSKKGVTGTLQQQAQDFRSDLDDLKKRMPEVYDILSPITEGIPAMLQGLWPKAPAPGQLPAHQPATQGGQPQLEGDEAVPVLNKILGALTALFTGA